jgi:hypothetical protein
MTLSVQKKLEAKDESLTVYGICSKNMEAWFMTSFA